jgi:PTS system nitrogen regulatory IIA component
MKLKEITNNELIKCHIEVASKKMLLELVSQLFSNVLHIEADNQLFDDFIAREKLGSTALGHGVAIPHIRSKVTATPMLAILQLQSSIDFDAEDHRPVDIIFALVVPHDANNEHLQLLAECSSILVQQENRKLIRAATEPQDIMRVIENNCLNYAEVI